MTSDLSGTVLEFPNGEPWAQTWMYVRSQFPQFMQEEGDELIQFVEAYYQWLENNVTGVLTHHQDIADIDRTPTQFVDFFIKEVTSFIDGHSLAIDKRDFIKYAHELFQTKGSSNSFVLFFRALFGESIEVSLPKRSILMPSAKQHFSGYTIALDMSPLLSIIEEKLAIGLDFTSAVYNNETIYSPTFYIKNGARLEIFTTRQPTEIIEANKFMVVRLGDYFYRLRVESVLGAYVPKNIVGFREGDRFEIRLNEGDTNQSHENALLSVSEVAAGPITSLLVFSRGSGYAVGDAVTFFEGGTEQTFSVKTVSGGGAITKLGSFSIPSFVATTRPVAFDVVTPSAAKFSDSPQVRITTQGGAGFLVVAKVGTRVTGVRVDNNGCGITSSSFNPRFPVQLYSHSRVGKITDGPIVEFFAYSYATSTWVATGAMGKIWSSSADGASLTVIPIPAGITSNKNQAITPKNILAFSSRIYRLDVIKPETGTNLGTFCYASHPTILPITKDSATFTTVTENKLFLLNDRQVLDSSSAVVRSKAQFHEFAYDLKTSRNSEEWAPLFDATVHPAGMQRIHSYVIQDTPKVVSSSVQRKKKMEFVLDQPASYAWPNRTFAPVIDKTVSGKLDANELVFPARGFSAVSGNQASDGMIIATNDEYNDERTVYDIDYNVYFADLLNIDDPYLKKQIPMRATEYEELAREVDDPYLWRGGWATHSADLDAPENNIDLGPDGGVQTIFTQYSGTTLSKAKTSFPNGSSLIRYQILETNETDGGLILTNKFQNVTYPADNTGANYSKLTTEELSSKAQYVDPNGVTVYTDFSKSSIVPSTHISLLRDTVTLDNSYGYFNLNENPGAFYDYEAQGHDSDTVYSIGKTTQKGNGTTTQVSIKYTLSGGKGTQGKVDGWFDGQNRMFVLLDDANYSQIVGADIDEIDYVRTDSHGKLSFSEVVYPAASLVVPATRISSFFTQRETDLKNALKGTLEWSLPEEADEDEIRATALKLYARSLLSKTTKRLLIGQNLITQGTNYTDFIQDTVVSAAKLPSMISWEWNTLQTDNTTILALMADRHAAGCINAVRVMWANPFDTNSTGPTVADPSAAKSDTHALIVDDPAYNATNYNYWLTSVTNLATFLGELETADIPVIVILYPLCNNNTVWYGYSGTGNNADMISGFRLLWTQTLTHLSVDNAAWCHEEAYNASENAVQRLVHDETDFVSSALSGTMTETEYDKLQTTGKPILLSRFRPATTDGTYDVRGVVQMLRAKKYHRIIGIIFDEDAGAAKYSLASNTHVADLAKDVWVMTNDTMAWLPWLTKAKAVEDEQAYIWQDGPLRGNRILYTGLDAFDKKWRR